MSITISLAPEQERKLAARAAQSGQDLQAYVHRLIERDIQAAPTALDEVLAPVRLQFEQSGLTDDDLTALVEEAREELWHEAHGRPSRAS